MSVDLSTLSGPVARWKFDEGSGPIAANSFASPINDGTNLLFAPDTFHGEAGYAPWAISSGVTKTLDQTNRRGDATAVRLQATSGGLRYTVTGVGVPAGQHTFSLYVKSGNGSDQTIRLWIAPTSGGAAVSSNISVTNAGGWQRVSFTATSATPVTALYITNDDANSAFDIVVGDIQFEAGASATTYRLQTWDWGLYSDTPYAWSSEGLVSSDGGKLAVATSSVPKTFSQMTLHAVIKYNSFHTYDAGITEVTSINKLFAPTVGSGTGCGALVANGSVGNPATIASGQFWCLTITWDGSKIRYYLNGTFIRSAAASTAFTPKGLLLGGFSGLGFYGTVAEMVLYDTAHSASDVRSAYSALKASVSAKSVTLTDIDEFVAFEGDSITDPAGATAYPGIAMAAISPYRNWALSAVSGSVIGTKVSPPAGSLWSRSSDLNEGLLPTKRKRVLSLLIGANHGNETPAEFVAALKEYCLFQIAAGWIIDLTTLTPCATGGYNTWRNTVNSLIIADTSFYHTLCRFDLVNHMGADGDEANTTYYSDGKHPTVAGQTLLAAAKKTSLEAALAISTSTPWSAYIDDVFADGVWADGVWDSGV